MDWSDSVVRLSSYKKQATQPSGHPAAPNAVTPFPRPYSSGIMRTVSGVKTKRNGNPSR